MGLVTQLLILTSLQVKESREAYGYPGVEEYNTS